MKIINSPEEKVPLGSIKYGQGFIYRDVHYICVQPCTAIENSMFKVGKTDCVYALNIKMNVVAIVDSCSMVTPIKLSLETD